MSDTQSNKSSKTPPTNDGTHGGNRGGDQHANTDGAKGSSRQGGHTGADQSNQGGGQDAEKANQTQNTTEYKSDYGTGNAASSPANDGGKIDDQNNS